LPTEKAIAQQSLLKAVNETFAKAHFAQNRKTRKILTALLRITSSLNMYFHGWRCITTLGRKKPRNQLTLFWQQRHFQEVRRGRSSLIAWPRWWKPECLRNIGRKSYRVLLPRRLNTFLHQHFFASRNQIKRKFWQDLDRASCVWNTRSCDYTTAT